MKAPLNRPWNSSVYNLGVGIKVPIFALSMFARFQTIKQDEQLYRPCIDLVPEQKDWVVLTWPGHRVWVSGHLFHAFNVPPPFLPHLIPKSQLDLIDKQLS